MSLPEVLRVEWFRFPAETLKAIQQRLSHDMSAQQLVLQTMQNSGDINQQAIAARLLSVSSQQHEALRKWANLQIQRLRSSREIPLMSHDVLRGQAWPFDFCLLDACLTRKRE